MACLTTIADSKIYTWGVLNFYISNHETRTLFEADHGSRIEGLLVIASLPPSSSLSINDRCLAFTLNNDIILLSVLATNEYSLIIWSLAVFYELQGGSSAKVEYCLRLDAEHLGCTCHLVCTAKHPCTSRYYDHTASSRNSIQGFLNSFGVICCRCRCTIVFDVKRIC